MWDTKRYSVIKITALVDWGYVWAVWDNEESTNVKNKVIGVFKEYKYALIMATVLNNK